MGYFCEENVTQQENDVEERELTEKVPENAVLPEQPPIVEESMEDKQEYEKEKEETEKPAEPIEKTKEPAEKPVFISTAEAAKKQKEVLRPTEEKISDETALITAGMVIRGDMTASGSLDLAGSIIGDVKIRGDLKITGTIEGTSEARRVISDKAKINGDIHSAGAVDIGQDSIIIGNIFAKSAVIAGAVKGDVDVNGLVILESSAIVMGNIKSESVQISSGATVEGLCSQCYAAVSPASFFDEYEKSNK